MGASVRALVVVGSLMVAGCSAIYAPAEGGGDGDGPSDAGATLDSSSPGSCLAGCQLGRCEPSGACSVYDETCASGRSYPGDGQCVRLCAGGDDFEVIAPAFDAVEDSVFLLAGVSSSETRFGGLSSRGDDYRWVTQVLLDDHEASTTELGVRWEARLEEDVVFVARDGDVVVTRVDEAPAAMRLGRFSGGSASLSEVGGITAAGHDFWLSRDRLRAYLSDGSSLAAFERPSPPRDFADVDSYAIEGIESFTLSSDELELVYAKFVSQERGLDLFRSTRASLGAPFADGAPLSQLNSLDDDDRPALSADGATLYFQRRGPAGGEASTPLRSRRSCGQ